MTSMTVRRHAGAGGLPAPVRSWRRPLSELRQSPSEGALIPSDAWTNLRCAKAGRREGLMSGLMFPLMRTIVDPPYGHPNEGGSTGMLARLEGDVSYPANSVHRYVWDEFYRYKPGGREFDKVTDPFQFLSSLARQLPSSCSFGRRMGSRVLSGRRVCPSSRPSGG